MSNDDLALFISQPDEENFKSIANPSLYLSLQSLKSVSSDEITQNFPITIQTRR